MFPDYGNGAPRHGLAVARANGEFHVLAARPFAPGETLLTVEGELRARPTRHSLQIGWDLHIAVDESLELEYMLDHFPWRFLNHACEGNVLIRGRDVIAVRAIPPGEEIRFNYNATEFEMASPFHCRCGSPACERTIRGFKHLSRREREQLRPLLNTHLLELLDGDSEQAAAASAP